MRVQREEWVQWVLWFCFGFGALWIVGYPVYILLGVVLWWYYFIKWWQGFIILFDPPDPEHNAWNFIIYRWRRSFVFELAFYIGILWSLVPGLGTVSMLWLGLLTWIS